MKVERELAELWLCTWYGTELDAQENILRTQINVLL